MFKVPSSHCMYIYRQRHTLYLYAVKNPIKASEVSRTEKRQRPVTEFQASFTSVFTLSFQILSYCHWQTPLWCHFYSSNKQKNSLQSLLHIMMWNKCTSVTLLKGIAILLLEKWCHWLLHHILRSIAEVARVMPEGFGDAQTGSGIAQCHQL